MALRQRAHAGRRRGPGNRPDTSLDRLARLKPAFRPGGIVTPGNSSSLNDGAAAVVLASPSAVERWSLRPLASVAGSAAGGAIALGHPLGCSGARLVVTLLGRLEREGGRRGLATLCVGVGQGAALLLQR